METLLSTSSNPEYISFALGLPALEGFPITNFQQCVNDVLQHDALAMQYAPPLEELKEHIIQLMKNRGVECTREQILLTSGAQQGINLLVKLLLKNRGKVMLEELAYPGIMQTIASYNPQVITIPTCLESGIDIDQILHYLQAGNRPSFLYIVTDGSNPLGLSQTNEVRCQLAEIAEKYNMPIIEDDPYGFLNYDKNIKPISTYNKNHVFYVGSFSKIFAPSLRCGWIIGPSSLIRRLASIKESSDINTATFAQRVILSYLSKFNIHEHIAKVRDVCLGKRNHLIGHVLKQFPDTIQYKLPQSGIFLWIELENHNTTQLLEIALKEIKVAFVPSEAFASSHAVKKINGMRLNFSRPSIKEIDVGIEKLGRLIKQL